MGACLRGVVAASLLLLPGVVLAQSNAAAEAMFQRGVEAMEAGRFEVACPALAESQRLEPRPGTLYALAECEAQRGRLATAATHYSDYINQVASLPARQAANHADRRRRAVAQLEALRPRTPQLTLKPPPGGPFEIFLDSLQVGAPMLDVALPVDPGPHRWRVRAADGLEASGDLEVEPGQRLTVELQAPAPRPQPPGSSAPPVAPPPPPPAPRHRTLAYAVGGAGALVLGVGAVAGIVAINQKRSVDEECAGKFCSPRGLEAADSARSAATVSTVGVALGSAALAAAAVLWVIGRPQAQAAIGPGGVWLRGAF